MKKLLLTAVIACSGLSLFAQTNSTVSTSPVSFGIRAGVNLSKSTGDAPAGVSTKSLLGLNAGVFANFHLSESFGIQPELAWSTLGDKTEGNIPGLGNAKYKTVLNYLTLPVLAKYTFTGSGFSLYAGPQVGFLLSAKQKSGDVSGDVKDSFKSTDFAGVAGAEFEFPNTPFNISGRYQFGLTKVLEAGSDSKINAATFTLGYRFN